MAWKRVQAQYSNAYDSTVSVSVRDVETQARQTIVSNRIHPYFVQTARDVGAASEGHVYAGVIDNGYWVDAADLQAGDWLLNDDGSWAEVVDVQAEDTPLTAYNLTVADFHTYFVAANQTADAVWVHNECYRDYIDDAKWKNDDGSYDWINPLTGERERISLEIDGKKVNVHGDTCYPNNILKICWDLTTCQKVYKTKFCVTQTI